MSEGLAFRGRDLHRSPTSTRLSAINLVLDGGQQRFRSELDAPSVEDVARRADHHLGRTRCWGDIRQKLEHISWRGCIGRASILEENLDGCDPDQQVGMMGVTNK
jgi:hypothetical protein